MNEKVCVVTVTYGNRFQYLSQVVDAAFREGADNVVIVENGVSEESHLKIIERYSNEKRVIIKNLLENTGSAGGFYNGIKTAIEETDCEYIWLLDDDNVPLQNSLNQLKKTFGNFGELEKNKTLLFSLRLPEGYYRLIMMRKNKRIETSVKFDSFIGLSIEKLPKYFFKFITEQLLRKTKNDRKLDTFEELVQKLSFEINNFPLLIPSSYGPYGGSFFNRNILNYIGLPNVAFYLYADDIEWTYRITKIGGQIFLCTRSFVYDIIPSWSQNQSNIVSSLIHSEIKRLYYVTRNLLYFYENNFVKNRFKYSLNKFVFSKIVYLLLRIKDRQKALVFNKALKDSQKGILGKANEEGLI